MTAIQAYILAKQFAQSAASGITGIKYEDGQLVFELTSGDPLQVPVPMPKDGVSIKEVKIEKGHLMCTLSDDTTIDAGEVTGGSDDGGVVLSNSFDELPPTGNEINLYITTDNNNAYYWNGEGYQQLIASSSGTLDWKTF